MIKNKTMRLLAVVVALILVAVAALGISIAIGNSNNTIKEEITLTEAQAIVDATLDKLPNNIARRSISATTPMLRSTASITETKKILYSPVHIKLLI